MAGSVNKVILVGNCGKDPEIKRTQDGRALANLSLATSERWTDKNSGEKREKTEWHRVVVFADGLVKLVEQYVRKGTKLYVEGSLATREWEDQQGVKRYSTEVVVKAFSGTITRLGGKGDGDGGEQNASHRERDGAATSGRYAVDNREPRSGKATAAPADDYYNDDIPF
jgi:single-strand DNA-binding protein